MICHDAVHLQALFYTIYKTTQYAVTMNTVKQSIHTHNQIKLTRLPATDLTRGATVTFKSQAADQHRALVTFKQPGKQLA